MKLAISLVALVILPGCAELRTVAVEETGKTQIEKGTVVEQFISNMGFGDFINMDISQNTELQNQGMEREFIEQASLASLTLEIIEPQSGQDFTFIDSLEFYVSAPNLEKKMVARGSEFESGSRTIRLETLSVDLAPYVKSTSMDISTEVTGRRPQNNTTIEASLVFEVIGTVPGFGCSGSTDSQSVVAKW